MSDPSGRPTATQVVRELAGELGERAERDGNRSLAETLQAALSRPGEPETTLVVVGETKRGKSSLINALVGRRGLSPVDEDIATSVHVVVRHSQREVVVAHGDEGSVEVHPQELADWATERGDRARAGKVSSVEIGLDHPLLARGLTLIDTPGVGGLDAAHRQITLAALARADALLFVLDPDAPLSRPELDFLREVSERLRTVLFVLTKVDLYPAWQTILESDRELLARLDEERDAGAGRRHFTASSFIPVSSALKEEADALVAAGDEELGRELLADSGFPELQAAIEGQVIGRARVLRALNLAALCRSALASLELPLRVDSEGDDASLRDYLEAAQARQEEFRASQKSWPVDLGAELEGLRVKLDVEYERGTAELLRSYEERIADSDESAEEWLPPALAEDLRALAARLDAELQEGVADILDRLLHEFDLDADARAGPASPGRRDIRLAPLTAAPGTEGPSGAQKAFEYVRGGSLGAMLGARLIDLALPGVGLLVGTGAGLILARVTSSLGKGQRERLAERQQAMKFVQRALGPVARTEIRSPLQARMAEIRRDLTNEIRAAIDQRAGELQSALARQQRLVQEGQREQAKAKQQAERGLKELGALRSRLDTVERALESARASGGAAGGEERGALTGQGDRRGENG